MGEQANGTFDVTMAPAESSEPTIGRMSFTKRFSGDLDAVSHGEMLAVRTAIDGSAGYVAMERVIGSLAGRSGSFALQHSGTMNRTLATLTVSVVPDSGTGDLEGIAGTMTIAVAGGRHDYSFSYRLH